jgi:serine/threonine-protein kinase
MAQPIQDLANAPDVSGPNPCLRSNVARVPRAGDVLGDKYLLTRVIGEGGMGVVFEAVHRKLRRRVAVKMPLARERSDDAFARFEREARATSRIPSPHVARVLDVDATSDGQPYMVMELLTGRDLERELATRGAFRAWEAVDCILQACAAVSAAHRAGIIHLDLKPANLFLTRAGDRTVVKVLDFGIARTDGEDAARAPVGTAAYMSPEQARGAKAVDARADVFALGVILFEMIAGAPPFADGTTAAIAALVADAKPSLRAHRRDVPDALDRAVKRALAARPDDRFESVDAFAAAIARYGSRDALVGPFSYRPSSPEIDAPAPGSVRRRARALGLVSCCLAAIAIAIMTIQAISSARSPGTPEPIRPASVR